MTDLNEQVVLRELDSWKSIGQLSFKLIGLGEEIKMKEILKPLEEQEKIISFPRGRFGTIYYISTDRLSLEELNIYQEEKHGE